MDQSYNYFELCWKIHCFGLSLRKLIPSSTSSPLHKHINTTNIRLHKAVLCIIRPRQPEQHPLIYIDSLGNGCNKKICQIVQIIHLNIKDNAPCQKELYINMKSRFRTKHHSTSIHPRGKINPPNKKKQGR